MRVCWCGNTEYESFGPEYGRCLKCNTLVLAKHTPNEKLKVVDDETDFYGKQYWLGHQEDSFGYPDIVARSRDDLTERNLHWLKTLLKYKLPPSSVLEIGCAHGSFVALMNEAGFQSSGVEMSPWVVDYGRKTFGINVEVGPIQNLNIVKQSLDVIILMDVLEHFPDPISVMSHCLDLLKEDGVLLIQTPEFNKDYHFEDLIESKSPFLEQLKPEEHLYLFGKESVSLLFKQLGVEFVSFEPAIFAHYDMFFLASKAPLKKCTDDDIESSLLKSKNGRLTLALLDIRARELALLDRLIVAEQYSNASREQLANLQSLLVESESDRAARLIQIEKLTAMMTESEVDRESRGHQIMSLTETIGEAEVEKNRLNNLSQSQQMQLEMVAKEVKQLLSRPSFRAGSTIARWREVRRIAQTLGI
jgi:2-polyprenyl-3-methyl-5-hydroxy-6-metoxy-1,4-benzoquinol methylase